MKQAQQMQASMQQAQEELANIEVNGEAGGGLVKVVMTGRHDVKRVSIDDSLMQDDKEMLEDLLAAGGKYQSGKDGVYYRRSFSAARDEITILIRWHVA